MELPEYYQKNKSFMFTFIWRCTTTSCFVGVDAKPVTVLSVVYGNQGSRSLFLNLQRLSSDWGTVDKSNGKNMADIVDIAVGAGCFKTLVTAVQAANLVETLKSRGPFTVFAPMDDAFAKLPPGTLQTLVQNVPQLARILTYHVVPDKLMKAELAKLGSVTSVEGSPIKIDCSDSFEVKNATVVTSDIEADNGVIHVIDTVILMG